MRVLRASFFALLLANLLLFAYGKGYLGPASAGGEGERLAAQLAPERIRIAAVGAPPAAPTAEACRAVAGLTRDGAQRLAEQLHGADKELKPAVRLVEDPSSFWVYIPPAPDKEQTDKKVAELKRLQVEDFLVIRDGPRRNAISLGVFKSEESAKEHLAVLQKKGVRSARLEPRAPGEAKAVLELRASVDALDRLQLPAEFAAATVGECVPAKKE